MQLHLEYPAGGDGLGHLHQPHDLAADVGPGPGGGAVGVRAARVDQQHLEPLPRDQRSAGARRPGASRRRRRPPARVRSPRPRPRPARRPTRRTARRSGRPAASSSSWVPSSSTPPASTTRDAVGPLGGRQAVGDHDHRPPGHERLDRLLDLELGARVEAGGGLVEDQHARVGEEGAGQRDTTCRSPADRRDPRSLTSVASPSGRAAKRS